MNHAAPREVSPPTPAHCQTCAFTGLRRCGRRRPSLRAGDHWRQRGHHLATVANAEREGVAALETGRELVRQRRVEPHRTSPAFTGTKRVAVAEPISGDSALEFELSGLPMASPLEQVVSHQQLHRPALMP